MSTMASQITSVSIFYLTVCSGQDQRRHQSSLSLAFCAGNSPVTGEFPAQKASDAENVSISWRHHILYVSVVRYCAMKNKIRYNINSIGFMWFFFNVTFQLFIYGFDGLSLSLTGQLCKQTTLRQFFIILWWINVWIISPQNRGILIAQQRYVSSVTHANIHWELVARLIIDRYLLFWFCYGTVNFNEICHKLSFLVDFNVWIVLLWFI